MADKKLIKIYVEDWKVLNDYLSIRQVQEGRRLTFPEVLHELIEGNVKVIVEKAKESLKR